MGFVVIIAVLIVLAVLIDRRMQRRKIREIPARIVAYLGWGTLLVPLALMVMQVWGIGPWTRALVVLAAAIAIARPAAAADLATVALMLTGLYGVLQGVFWHSITLAPIPWHQVIYGTVVIDSWGPAALAALEGLTLAGFALWLAPRTIGRRRWAAALAAQMPGLANIWPLSTVARPPAGREQSSRGMFIKVLRGRLHERGWGTLLLPVAILALPLYSGTPAAGAVVVLAATVALLLPVVAAKILPFALAVIGLIGIGLAVSFTSSAPGGLFLYRMYGIAFMDSPRQGMLAGAEGLAILAFALWLAPRTYGSHGQLTAMAGRVQRLAQTRKDAVDVAAAELRRVERDLHDGAQARLVALGMSLRAAERLIHTNPMAAQALVAEARDASSRALTDLRDLVRGIYPPVLADRGLGDAIQALALDTPIRTELDIDLPGRPARPVESAVYFAVAEVLANAVKHADARLVHIRMVHSGRMLRAEVTDDGAGGANPAAGTGLLGVERRLGTFDGVLAVSSPPGGPTIVVIEVPCELSSPKTFSS